MLMKFIRTLLFNRYGNSLGRNTEIISCTSKLLCPTSTRFSPSNSSIDLIARQYNIITITNNEISHKNLYFILICTIKGEV